MRTCRHCGEDKPLSDYCKDKSRKDGIHPNCRECRNAYNRQATANNPEAVRARLLRYQQAHPEKVAAHQAAWRARHPDYSAKANRKWREENPGADSAYYQANKDAARARYLKRRAIKKAATVGIVDLDSLWERDGGICQLCGDPIDRTFKAPHPLTASVDHIVPLARGGKHEQANLQWAHLVCNRRKGARVPAH